MPNNLLDIYTLSSVNMGYHINKGGTSMQKLEILDKGSMRIAIQQEIRRSQLFAESTNTFTQLLFRIFAHETRILHNVAYESTDYK